MDTQQTQNHVSEQDEHEHEHSVESLDLVRIGLVAVAALFSWIMPWRPVDHVDVIALVAALVGGYPIFKEALSALWARRMTMELSMTIAILAALAIGEFLTTVVIVLFVLVAEVLEHLTVHRGRAAINDLLNLLPQVALVRREGQVRELRLIELQQGDTVVVKPGSRLPVDGVVISGRSFIDQSAVTGESMPVEKVVGSQVYAGTINQTGALDVHATGVGRDTAFGKIIDLVEQAEHTRAPIQKTADRLAGYLVYFALGSAVLTFLLTRDLRSTISVVIVAGACGIAAGTPLAILGAIGRAARLGVIIKGGLHLEALGRIDTVVLDKTGTLTLGKPEVVKLHALHHVSERELLSVAASAEMPSEHPIAKAIVSKAQASDAAVVEPDHFESTTGGGVVCTLENAEVVVGSRSFLSQRGIALADLNQRAEQPSTSEVLVARAGRLLGSIQIADVLRTEAARAVAALHEMGLRTVLLTGDAAAVATTVGQQLGVSEVVADLLPHQKQERVKHLVDAGRRVAMVGDGINDAPALKQANVGIAMGSGTAIARESADVLLLGDDLLMLVETLRIARRCHRIIKQNFWGTITVDAAGVLLAAFGILNPLFAAFIHVSSELAFILNSTRLLVKNTHPLRSLSNSDELGERPIGHGLAEQGVLLGPASRSS